MNCVDNNAPSIHIVDNGKGMSRKDIQDKWLFVAYSAKKEGTEDEIGVRNRHYAGNKGVGRFSFDLMTRICKALNCNVGDIMDVVHE